MNERIQALALQAKLKTELWNNPEPFVIYKEDVNYPGGLEKFAELIVKECMEQVWYTREDGINGNVSEVIKDRIKQHFGVEE